VNKQLRQEPQEEVTGTWWTVMNNEKSISLDRIIVLTTDALYRMHWLPEHGYIGKFRRMPLDNLVRAYQADGKLIIVESVEQNGTWEKLVRILAKNEPPEARPWRTNTHVLHTRWYMPLGDDGCPDKTKLCDMLRAIKNVVPRDIDLPLSAWNSTTDASPPGTQRALMLKELTESLPSTSAPSTSASSHSQSGASSFVSPDDAGSDSLDTWETGRSMPLARGRIRSNSIELAGSDSLDAWETGRSMPLARGRIRSNSIELDRTRPASAGGDNRPDSVDSDSFDGREVF